MDGDCSCLWGGSDDVTGGGETTAFDTKENRGGHLGGVRGSQRKRGDSPEPVCGFWDMMQASVKKDWCRLNEGRSVLDLCTPPHQNQNLSCKQVQSTASQCAAVRAAGKPNLTLCKILQDNTSIVIQERYQQSLLEDEKYSATYMKSDKE